MKTFSVREQQDFLLAVVNDLPNVMTKYKGWLPNPTLPSDRQAFASIYEMFYLWRIVTEGKPDWNPSSDPKEFTRAYLRWQNSWSDAKIPSDPKELTRTYLRWQTFKLKVVWDKALASNWEDALSAANNMIVETTRYDAALYAAPWLRKTKQALEWLYENTDRLRRCGFAECKTYPYFIVSPTRKKYCSDRCKELAEIARIDERNKDQVASRQASGANGRISLEGKINISKAQKERWAKRRKAAKAGVE